MMNRERERAGAALLEAVVALAIAALVLVTAREIVEAIESGTNRLAEMAAEADRRGNADRLLRTLIGQVESATVVHGSVVGDERETTIETWCDVPDGWKERCAVEVAFTPQDDGSALIVRGLPGGALVLLEGFAYGEWLYLADARHGGTWLSDWTHQVSTPLALAAVLEGDTLIFRIGERG